MEAQGLWKATAGIVKKGKGGFSMSKTEASSPHPAPC